jgi:hypothetical protein
MSSSCKRPTTESLRRPEPCRIDAKVKRRTGDPKWWCTTHAQPAWGEGGARLDRCPGSEDEPPDADDVLELDLDQFDSVGVWGALAPAIVAGQVVVYPGAVHVHARSTAGGPKAIDRSCAIVHLRRGELNVTIDGEDARAWSLSAVAGVPVADVRCRHCGRGHTDRDEFAVRPHLKHQCAWCSRDFWVRDPSVGNLLVPDAVLLNSADRPTPVPTPEHLDVDTARIGGIAIWATNPAIVWSGPRAESEGLHVHVWDGDGRPLVDDTFGSVAVDGQSIDAVQLRRLQVLRSIPAVAALVATVVCDACESAEVVEIGEWEPSTEHRCVRCTNVVRTRRRLAANPLVALERELRRRLP